MQEWVKIGEIEVPIIIESEVKYFPVSFITLKLLKRTNKNGLIHKGNRSKYEKFIRNFKMESNASNQQSTNCISENGLKELLSNSQVGRLSLEQRKSQNELHRYLGIELLTEREEYINELTEEFLNEHDIYTRDIIKECVSIKQKENDNTVYRLCSGCNKYYPLDKKFFTGDKRSEKGFLKICKLCGGMYDKFTHYDKAKNIIYKKCGENDYIEVKDGSIVEVYKQVLNGVFKKIPHGYNTKENYLKFVQYLFNNGMIDKDNISSSILKDKYKLASIGSVLKINEVYSCLFGENFYYYPWKYKNFSFSGINLTYDIANKIFNNYLVEFNIKIDNVLEFDYYSIASKCKLKTLINKDLLYFIVQYNNFKYPAYKFKVNGANYYKDRNNRIFDLKYLIEKDMKIPIEKIPLYLTITSIRGIGTTSLYTVLKKYYKSLFNWVNECYPDRFIETDFNINIIRNDFDSMEESVIHDVLKGKFDNVVYNSRNTENTIKINGMEPDWLVFTENRCWIVEYFGMYGDTSYNQRVRDYIKRTDEKIEKYENMEGYGKVFLFPKDLKDNMESLKDKITAII